MIRREDQDELSCQYFLPSLSESPHFDYFLFSYILSFFLSALLSILLLDEFLVVNGLISLCAESIRF